MLEKLAQFGQNAGARLRVKSALNPLLWLSGVTVPTCLVAAYHFSSVPSLVPFCGMLVGMAMIIPAGTLIIGGMFAIWKPEKLQSEDYQIRQQALVLMKQGSRGAVLDTSAVVAVANPTARAALEASEYGQ